MKLYTLTHSSISGRIFVGSDDNIKNTLLDALVEDGFVISEAPTDYLPADVETPEATFQRAKDIALNLMPHATMETILAIYDRIT